jgi:hypothetical protein
VRQARSVQIFVRPKSPRVFPVHPIITIGGDKMRDNIALPQDPAQLIFRREDIWAHFTVRPDDDRAVASERRKDFHPYGMQLETRSS